MGLTDDPHLGARATALPPNSVDVDGHVWRFNREVSVEQGLRLAGRGLRTFVLSPVLSAEVSTDEFRKIMSAYSSYFSEDGPGHAPDAFVCAYRRRADRAWGDTRIVVACILEFESLKNS